MSTRPQSMNQFTLSSDRELGDHDAYSLVKCCESLAFLVRDVAHITPYNFENCVHCIRTFVEASVDSGKSVIAYVVAIYNQFTFIHMELRTYYLIYYVLFYIINEEKCFNSV